MPLNFGIPLSLDGLGEKLYLSDGWDLEGTYKVDNLRPVLSKVLIWTKLENLTENRSSAHPIALFWGFTYGDISKLTKFWEGALAWKANID